MAGTEGFKHAGRDGKPPAQHSRRRALLSFDPSGRLLIADTGDFTVKRVNADGEIGYAGLAWRASVWQRRSYRRGEL